MISFSPDASETLRFNGWTIVDVPAELTLAALRRQGAPFRGQRYFREFAADVVEVPTIAHALAYQPSFLEGSLNRSYAECDALVERFNQGMPPGCRATIGSAATYVYVLWEHGRRTRVFPLVSRFTWSTDVCRDGHLIVGVFGGERPLVVAPHATSGAGVGLMPLIVPAE